MGSGINNKINEFLCNPKNVKKRRSTRIEKCYGLIDIATAYKVNANFVCLFPIINVTVITSLCLVAHAISAFLLHLCSF